MKYVIIFHYSMIFMGMACALWLVSSGASLSQMLVAFLFSLSGLWFGLTQRAVDPPSARQAWRNLEDSAGNFNRLRKGNHA